VGDELHEVGGKQGGLAVLGGAVGAADPYSVVSLAREKSRTEYAINFILIILLRCVAVKTRFAINRRGNGN
jgi:hypothetical protein